MKKNIRRVSNSLLLVGLVFSLIILIFGMLIRPLIYGALLTFPLSAFLQWHDLFPHSQDNFPTKTLLLVDLALGILIISAPSVWPLLALGSVSNLFAGISAVGIGVFCVGLVLIVLPKLVAFFNQNPLLEEQDALVEQELAKQLAQAKPSSTQSADKGDEKEQKRYGSYATTISPQPQALAKQLSTQKQGGVGAGPKNEGSSFLIHEQDDEYEEAELKDVMKLSQEEAENEAKKVTVNSPSASVFPAPRLTIPPSVTGRQDEYWGPEEKGRVLVNAVSLKGKVALLATATKKDWILKNTWISDTLRKGNSGLFFYSNLRGDENKKPSLPARGYLIKKEEAKKFKEENPDLFPDQTP